MKMYRHLSKSFFRDRWVHSPIHY